jgi:NDP-sugar pyrophosphorylase family protein
VATLIVLAGGFGTRLRSVVSDVPKPLAPVHGKSFLEHLIQQWKCDGVTEIILLLHYQADMVLDLVEKMKIDGRLGNMRIRSITEPVPLGTGGAINHALRTLKISTSFLVTNADTWLSRGVRAMQGTKPGTIGVVKVANTERYGSVILRGDSLVSFQEKQYSSGPGWINAGLYHLSPEIFSEWSKGRAFSLEQELFPMLAKNGSLCSERLGGDFIDIGIPEDYARFCDWIRSGKAYAL